MAEIFDVAGTRFGWNTLTEIVKFTSDAKYVNEKSRAAAHRLSKTAAKEIPPPTGNLLKMITNMPAEYRNECTVAFAKQHCSREESDRRIRATGAKHSIKKVPGGTREDFINRFTSDDDVHETLFKRHKH